MKMLTGKEIERIRLALGLTRTQLAARLGVSEGAVWRWENTDNHPRWDTMVKLNELAKEVDQATEPA